MAIRERERILENIVRLRRAEQKAPSSDIAAVREYLESQLEGTVSRNLAAKLLGVSHTALNNWINAGDVPVVISKRGRKEVPISTVLDLQEEVVGERSSGHRKLHLLEPTMIEARRRAERMRPARGMPNLEADVDPHRRAELRSLAYHRALAPRLRRPMVEQAQRKLRRWQEEEKIAAHYAQAWEEVLAGSMQEIRAAIAADDERGRDLRQNSPFGGMLSEAERRKILAMI